MGNSVDGKVVETIEFQLSEMESTCDIDLAEKKVKSLMGVEIVAFDSSSGRIKVTFDPLKATDRDIARSISEAGLSCTRVKERRSRSTWWKDKQQLALYSSGIITLSSFILMVFGAESYITNGLFGVAVLVGVYYPARKAIIALINLVPTIHLLMLIGAVGAVLLGLWSEAAILVFVYSLGDVLESYAVDKARGAIRSLTELVPKRALVKRGSESILIPTDSIDVGETVIVRPGERIPMDGKVSQGSSYVDQSAVTGEPIPVMKKAGDNVFAGTINQNGSIEVFVEKLASETMLSKIICSVEEAQASRTSYQRFSDNFAMYYTPAMFVLGVLVAVIPPLFFGADWYTFILRGLVVFVVSCSCGLALSVPVAVVAAMANAARHGVVYKGGAYLETVDKVKAIAFDKTGTLTIGRPMVTDIRAYGGTTEKDLLFIASSIESKSSHPLAEAIVRKAKEEEIYSAPAVDDFLEVSGMGVSASVSGNLYHIGNARFLLERGIGTDRFKNDIEGFEGAGKTVVMVGMTERLIGSIAIADSVRPGAKEAVKRLREAGLTTVMLTGDNERSAQAIARQVGVDEWYSQLLPGDKVEVIKRLKQKYGSVAMVGDGINDAPAMAVSDAGIAMGAAGTDIAVEAGDLVLMSDDLSKIGYIRNLSHRTVVTIKQNIGFSLVNIAFMIGAALFGYLGLVSGLLLNEASAVLVILNALRLLKWREQGEKRTVTSVEEKGKTLMGVPE